jgi:hypothetical protein
MTKVSTCWVDPPTHSLVPLPPGGGVAIKEKKTGLNTLSSNAMHASTPARLGSYCDDHGRSQLCWIWPLEYETPVVFDLNWTSLDFWVEHHLTNVQTFTNLFDPKMVPWRKMPRNCQLFTRMHKWAGWLKHNTFVEALSPSNEVATP